MNTAPTTRIVTVRSDMEKILEHETAEIGHETIDLSESARLQRDVWVQVTYLTGVIAQRKPIVRSS